MLGKGRRYEGEGGTENKKARERSSFLVVFLLFFDFLGFSPCFYCCACLFCWAISGEWLNMSLRLGVVFTMAGGLCCVFSVCLANSPGGFSAGDRGGAGLQRSATHG